MRTIENARPGCLASRWSLGRAAARVAALTLLAVGWPLAAQDPPSPPLNDECTAMVLNRYTRINPDGTFGLGNVPVPLGAFRVRVICEREAGVEQGSSAFLVGVPNGDTPVGEILFGEQRDPIPARLVVTSPATVFTPAAPGAQLVTTGYLVDGTAIDLTLANSGTTYLSSNPSLATVTADGLVTSTRSGTFLVTATREGLIATIALRAELTDDRDGDGIPDDFEDRQSVDPGGIVVSSLPGVQVIASSSYANRPPGRLIDGNLRTSWLSAYRNVANRGASPFVEVQLPQATALAQLRVFGARDITSTYFPLAGRIQAWDGAGLQLYDSGVVGTAGPNHDLFLPVQLAGVRRVRFTATADVGAYLALGEVQLLSAAGGVGLNADDPTDAGLDFDQDGLTNLQEFQRGTDLFAPDSDGDGLTDGAEVSLGSSPLLADSDGDGLLDGAEVAPGSDSDLDGTINVLDADSDGDGLADGLEARLGLDPSRADSDLDGVPDGGEDSDGDRLPNFEEALAGTDPSVADSDGDGATDGLEVLLGCSPTTAERTTLSGRVVDGAGVPVAEARVQLVGQAAATLSANDGSYLLPAVTACPATLQLTARRSGGGLAVLRGRATVAAVVGGTSAVADLLVAPLGGPAFPAPRYGVDDEPTALAVGDLDGDGWLDVVTAGSTTSRALWRRGVADGPLAAPVAVALPAPASRLAVVDVDADGRLDLVALHGAAGMVSVLLGQPGGGLGPAVSTTVGGTPADLLVDDLDLDGLPDLALAQPSTLQVEVWRGDGAGSFGPRVPITLSFAPSRLLRGDLNADGRPDLLAYAGSARVSLLGMATGWTVAGGDPTGALDAAFVDADRDGVLDLAAVSGGPLTVRFGRGDGSFTSAVNVLGVATGRRLAVADLDADGLADVVVASGSGLALSVLHGTGDVDLFTVSQSFPTGSSPERLAVADLDRDGIGDLLSLAGGASDALTLHLAAGPRQYLAPRLVGPISNPTDLATAALNADVFPDLVVGQTQFFGFTSVVSNGDGSYGLQPSPTAAVQPERVAVLAADLDGRDDVAAAGPTTAGTSSRLFLQSGTGDGSFAAAQSYPLAALPSALAEGDFDTDGIADVAVASRATGVIAVYLASPAGGLVEPPLSLAAGSDPVALAAADVDGEGAVDLLAANFGSADLSLFRGHGDGSFDAEQRLGAGAGPQDLVARDLDGDGDLDLVVALETARSLAVLLNLDGSFAGAVELAVGAAPNGLVVSDVDGDGTLDLLAVSAACGEIALLPGLGAGAFGPPQRYAIGNAPAALVAADLDLDGWVDLATANRGDQAVGILPPVAAYRPRLADAGGVAPVVSFLAPTNGALVLAEADLRVRLTASDDVAVARVELWVDGGLYGTDTSAPYQFKLAAPLAAGTLSLEARAFDLAGNQGLATAAVTVINNPAPVVAITAPAAGTVLTEGATVRLVATASDNTAVAQLVFTVNGVPGAPIFAPPYEQDLSVPVGSATLQVTATATDDQGIAGSASATYDVVPDPLTTVVGSVVNGDGQPVVGAEVTVLATYSALTDAGGAFSISGVPTVAGDLQAIARQEVGGVVFSGSSAPFAPVPGGSTDVGVIVVRDVFAYGDPTDDVAESFDRGLDLVAVTVRPLATDVVVSARVAGTISASSFSAVLSLDLDQDPRTGSVSTIDARSPYGATYLGVELEIPIVRGVATDGTPLAISGDTLTLTIPLARLGGDPSFNFALLVYRDFAPERLDVAPNGGFFAVPPELDSDGDGVPDAIEVLLGLDRYDTDSDDDGVADGDEDFDQDRLTNRQEVTLGSDPRLVDTDGDGLGDGAEVLDHGTSPLLRDSDGGGRNDGAEVLFDGTEPTDPADDVQQLEVANTVPASDPAMVVDGAGNVHLAWRGDFCSELTYSMLSPTGETLIDDTPLTDGCLGASEIQLALGPDGLVHLLWRSGGTGFGDIGGLEYLAIDPQADDRDGSAADPAALRRGNVLTLATGVPDAYATTVLFGGRLAVDGAGRVHIVYGVESILAVPAPESQPGGLPGGGTLALRGLVAPAPGIHLVQLDAGGSERFDRVVSTDLTFQDNFGFGEVQSNTVAMAADLQGVHVALVGQPAGGGGSPSLYYLLLDATTGAVRIAATDLLSGTSYAAGYPSLGLTANGEVAVVYEDLAAATPLADLAFEVHTLRLDPSRDDQDGSPADPNALFVIPPPRLLTFPDSAPSTHPRAVFDADGNIFMSYIDNLSLFGQGDLFVRGSDPIGVNLVPRQAVTFDQSLDVNEPRTAAIAFGAPSIYVAWTGRTEPDFDEHLFLLIANPDQDRDGLANRDERARGTDPYRADTDGDGMGDGFEVSYGFDPLLAGGAGDDPDDDGLSNLDEAAAGSHPLLADTDGDGLPDGLEVLTYGSDPRRPDTDGDGLSDQQEVAAYNTDPTRVDTDGDQLPDGYEVAAGLDPLDANDGLTDADGDGLSRGAELALGTDPANPDSDGDGLLDGVEVGSYGTDPTLSDTDGDLLSDGEEVGPVGSEPLVLDSDGGGRSDGQEVLFDGTSPLAAGDEWLPVDLTTFPEPDFPASIGAPDVVVDAAGNLHAVWLDGRFDFCLEVTYAAWTPNLEPLVAPTPLTDDCRDHYRPSIAFDSGGRLHVLFEQLDGFYQLAHLAIEPSRDDQDGSPADPAVITVVATHVVANLSTEVSRPRLAVDAANRLLVVWLDEARGFDGEGFHNLDVLRYLRLTRDGAVSLAAREVYRGRLFLAHGGARPQVAADASGRAHIVFVGNLLGNPGIYYLMVDAAGTTRIAATKLTGGDGALGYPSVGIGPGSLVGIVYQDRVAGAVESLLLRLDADRDDRNGTPANPSQIIVLPPTPLTPADGRFSCSPRASFRADGSLVLSYLEQLRAGSAQLGELWVRGVAADGVTTRVAAQPISHLPLPVDTDAPAALVASPPSIAVLWGTAIDTYGNHQLLSVANPDFDRDGLSNVEEQALGTDPLVADTDGGGARDGKEVLIDGTNPLDPGDDVP